MNDAVAPITVDGRSTVFLIAQNRLLREALSKILSRKESLQVVGSCALTSDSLENIVLASPDVLVIDSLTMTTLQIQLVRDVQQRLGDLKLVMIGMESDGPLFLRAIREGAMGYLVKNASAIEVAGAISAVASGDAFCSPQLCVFLFRFAAQQNQMPNFQARQRLGLTNREQQLVGLISQSFSNKEIANRLQLAEQTVRNQIHRMLRKLGANHRLEVVDICRSEGIPV